MLSFRMFFPLMKVLSLWMHKLSRPLLFTFKDTGSPKFRDKIFYYTGNFSDMGFGLQQPPMVLLYIPH